MCHRFDREVAQLPDGLGWPHLETSVSRELSSMGLSHADDLQGSGVSPKISAIAPLLP